MFAPYTRNSTGGVVNWESLALIPIFAVHCTQGKDETLSASVCWVYTWSNYRKYTFVWIIVLSYGEGNGNPLQCSCLENPRDSGAWWAAVYGVKQSWTRLKWFSSSSTESAVIYIRSSTNAGTTPWEVTAPVWLRLGRYRVKFHPCQLSKSPAYQVTG